MDASPLIHTLLHLLNTTYTSNDLPLHIAHTQQLARLTKKEIELIPEWRAGRAATAANQLAKLQTDLRNTRTPTWDVYGAVDLFVNGKCTDLPEEIKLSVQQDSFYKLNPPAVSMKERILEKLIKSSHVPSQYSSSAVFDMDSVTFTVPYSHSVRLSLKYWHETKNWFWHVVSITLLLTQLQSLSTEELVFGGQRAIYDQFPLQADREGEADDHPGLQLLFDFVHEHTLATRLDMMAKQTLVLPLSQLSDVQYYPGKSLGIHYWPKPSPICQEIDKSPCTFRIELNGAAHLDPLNPDIKSPGDLRITFGNDKQSSSWSANCQEVIDTRHAVDTTSLNLLQLLRVNDIDKMIRLICKLHGELILAQIAGVLQKLFHHVSRTENELHLTYASNSYLILRMNLQTSQIQLLDHEARWIRREQQGDAMLSIAKLVHFLRSAALELSSQRFRSCIQLIGYPIFTKPVYYQSELLTGPHHVLVSMPGFDSHVIDIQTEETIGFNHNVEYSLHQIRETEHRIQIIDSYHGPWPLLLAIDDCGLESVSANFGRVAVFARMALHGMELEKQLRKLGSKVTRFNLRPTEQTVWHPVLYAEISNKSTRRGVRVVVKYDMRSECFGLSVGNDLVTYLKLSDSEFAKSFQPSQVSDSRSLFRFSLDHITSLNTLLSLQKQLIDIESEL